MKPRMIATTLLISLAPLSLHGAVVISGGHIDVPAFGYDTADGFEPHLHNEGGASGAIVDGTRVTDESEYEPDEAIVNVAVTSTTTLNGQTIFWLPDNPTQALNNGVPYVGIGLEELDAGDWTGPLTFRLSGISGPGNFLMWTFDAFNDPMILLDSGSLSKSISLAAGSHSHFNWGFSEAGLYELTFAISGTHVTDGLVSGEGMFAFAVPEPSTALLGALGALGLLRRRR